MSRLRAVTTTAAAALALSACAYFNSLYNARRFYTDAQHAAANGEVTKAASAYRSAIEKAAAAYRRDTTGRWSDAALELIGRSYFALADYRNSREAFERVLARGARGDQRAAAQAYLGASLVRSDLPAQALPPLDSAVAALPARSEMGAFARLWRARARFDLKDNAAGWTDLESAGGAPAPLGVDARLEGMVRAIALADTTRAAAAFASLLASPDAAVRADSMRVLADAAVGQWGGERVRRMLVADARSWPGTARQEMQLYRAGLAARAGDTATAITEADAVARGGGRSVGVRARVAAARWRLAVARDLPAADAVRSDLLVAVTDQDAQRLIRGLKMLDVMVDRGTQGEPLSLFAGAEFARDELGAPALARRLFLAYADLVPGAPWAPKALMAAAVLSARPGRDSIDAKLQRYAGSVYVAPRATRAADSAFTDSEVRLDRALAAAKGFAAQEAVRRDAGVTRVIAELDSVRTAARTDSLRIACGAFADSAGIAGVRGDSLRAACMRRDTAKVALFLKPDTVKRADSTGVNRLPAGRGIPRGTARDTIH